MTDKPREPYYRRPEHHGRYSLPSEGPTPDDYRRLENQIRELYEWMPPAAGRDLRYKMRELWPWLDTEGD